MTHAAAAAASEHWYVSQQVLLQQLSAAPAADAVCSGLLPKLLTASAGAAHPNELQIRPLAL